MSAKKKDKGNTKGNESKSKHEGLPTERVAQISETNKQPLDSGKERDKNNSATVEEHESNTIKIGEIKEGMQNFDVIGVVTQKNEFSMQTGKGAKLVMEDSFDEIIVFIYNEDADKIKVGDKIKIINAYCRRTKENDLCISKSKFGGTIELR